MINVNTSAQWMHSNLIKIIVYTWIYMQARQRITLPTIFVFQESGLSSWIGEQLTPLQALSPVAANFICCSIVCALTQCTSNTATATVFLPILAELVNIWQLRESWVDQGFSNGTLGRPWGPRSGSLAAMSRGLHQVALPWYCLNQVSRCIKYSPVKLKRGSRFMKAWEPLS